MSLSDTKVENEATPVPAAAPSPTATPAPAPAVAADAPPVATTPSKGPPVLETDAYSYETPADTEEFKRSFAESYLTTSKPKTIFVMTIGMPEFAGILDRPPLSVIKRKDLNEAYVPKAEDFKHEVKRRAHFYMNVEEESKYHTEELKGNHPLKTRRNKIAMPQPNQWLNTNLKKWLIDRPMKPNDKDIDFLRAHVEKLLEYLKQESENVAPDVVVLASPSSPRTSMIIHPISTPGPTTLSLPVLPADEHSYTSVNDTEEYKRSAALTYSRMSSKPRVVIAMALGMIEYQGILDRAPFSTARRKDLTDDFMPRAEDYRFEIRRRAHFFMNHEEESDYFTKELKKKHPLENMRGVVQLPQPAQWKIQALRGWLSERPLKPSKEDSSFIQESMQKILESLDVVMEREKVKMETSTKKSATKMPWGTANASGPGAATSQEDLLFDMVAKSDAVLEAVTKQNESQAIVNKITVLNQAISGYNQEIMSLRSTMNDIQTRLVQMEMKSIESPSDKLSSMIEEHNTSKTETEAKIVAAQGTVTKTREEISELTRKMEEMIEESNNLSRKRKHEEAEESEEANEPETQPEGESMEI